MSDNEDPWPTNANEYELFGLIGRGAFAKVYKGRCLRNNKIVAIKIIDLENSSSNVIDIWKEVLSMKLCDHPNVLRCYCCFNVNEALWIVTPIMSKGSLLRILQYLRRESRLDNHEGLEVINCLISNRKEWIVAAVIKQTTYGLQYLHSSNLLHRYCKRYIITISDIKAGNILIDENGRVCIADLGVGRIMEGSLKNAQAHTFVGTPCWMAPEVMNHDSYNCAADIWSLGITTLELYKGFPPYARCDAMEAMIRTCQGDPPSFSTYPPSNRSPSHSFRSWIKAVLKKDPVARPSVDKVLNMRFLSQVNDDESRDLLVKFLSTIPDLMEGDVVSKDKVCVVTPVQIQWKFGS